MPDNEEILNQSMLYADLRKARQRNSFRKLCFIVGSLGCLILLGLASTACGAANLNAADVIKIIISKIMPFLPMEVSSMNNAILWDIRLPRIVMGIVAGAGLAVSGTVMQGIMRNPLVSPFTIGISSAAGFGASVAIILGAGIAGPQKYLIVTNAFVFSLAASFLVYGLASTRGMRPETLVLSGIALNYFFSSVTSLLQYIASEEEVHAVVHWLFGSLTGITWENTLIVTIVLICCTPWLLRYAWDLNALAAGDDFAVTIGVHTRRVRTICLILSTLITASVISFTGIIGFVCLVAPHIARMIIGADHRYLIPYSGILGAILLLGADTLGRTAFKPSTIPVGIVVSVIGVPFFVYLILKTRREYFQ
jgi:iron complex transport system permease protein